MTYATPQEMQDAAARAEMPVDALRERSLAEISALLDQCGTTKTDHDVCVEIATLLGQLGFDHPEKLGGPHKMTAEELAAHQRLIDDAAAAAQPAQPPVDGTTDA